ncbi:hypothetical protein JKF63_05117 [Porcisia hertigi]|uniref:RING-type domain-containing protein n=1 Tax=Porcisia hertigi TaxID=2761500 RepID=A0A836ITB6_9TRYP|nr:hypothetical protein JKF63_05117 [Porcisia hertigi]
MGDISGAEASPPVHVHTVISFSGADSAPVGSAVDMVNAFLPAQVMVTAVMNAEIEIPDLPDDPASAREWVAHSCPPFSPQEVISTFDIVQQQPSLPITATARIGHSESGVGEETAASPSPPPPRALEVKECAICLEPLFATSGVRATPDSDANVANATLPLSRSTTADSDAPPIASQPSSSRLPAPLSPHDGATEATTAARTVREVYCGHRFHEPCILRWIQAGHYLCPLCRSPFVFE